MIRHSLLPALRVGEIDFTLGLLPSRPLGIEFASEVLYEDPVVAAVRSGSLVTLDADRLTRAGPRLTAETARLCTAIDQVRALP